MLAHQNSLLNDFQKQNKERCVRGDVDVKTDNGDKKTVESPLKKVSMKNNIFTPHYKFVYQIFISRKKLLEVTKKHVTPKQLLLDWIPMLSICLMTLMMNNLVIKIKILIFLFNLYLTCKLITLINSIN